MASESAPTSLWHGSISGPSAPPSAGSPISPSRSNRERPSTGLIPMTISVPGGVDYALPGIGVHLALLRRFGLGPRQCALSSDQSRRHLPCKRLGQHASQDHQQRDRLGQSLFAGAFWLLPLDPLRPRRNDHPHYL